MLMSAWVMVATSMAAASGQVTYVTDADAYVDAGSVRGLVVGQELKLERRKKPAGSCVVVQLSPERAVCRSERAAVGDRFTFNAAPPPKKPPPPKPLPRPPPPDVLETARQVVVQAPIERVKHTPAASSFSLRAQTTLRQQAWWSSTTPGSLFVRPSWSGGVRAGLPFSPRVVAQASVTITGDVLAPADQRFRPGELVEVYLWGASVGTRDGWLVGEAGRFLVKNVPGTLVLDGAQIGLRLWDGAVEVGTYGGLIPTLVTLMPGLDRVTAGAYAALELRPFEALTVLPRVSAGVITDASFAAPRADVAAQLQAVLAGVGVLGGTVRGGVPADGTAAPTLDVAAVDLELNPITPWRLAAGWRLMGANRFNIDAKNGAPPVQGTQHASASTSWEVLPGWRVGAFGGAGLNDATARTRAWVGPEVSVTNAFGSLGGFDVGYQEELGDWPGRSGWLGTRFNLAPVVLHSRVFMGEHAAFDDAYREVGMTMIADAELLPGLSLTARVNGHQGLPALMESSRATPTVVVGDVALRGSM